MCARFLEADWTDSKILLVWCHGMSSGWELRISDWSDTFWPPIEWLGRRKARNPRWFDEPDRVTISHSFSSYETLKSLDSVHFGRFRGDLKYPALAHKSWGVEIVALSQIWFGVVTLFKPLRGISFRLENFASNTVLDESERFELIKMTKENSMEVDRVYSITIPLSVSYKTSISGKSAPPSIFCTKSHFTEREQGYSS